SSSRRGGCAANKMPRSILSPRRRGGGHPQHNSVGIESPPRPLHRRCFAIFYGGRGHPSSKRRGKSSSSTVVIQVSIRVQVFKPLLESTLTTTLYLVAQNFITPLPERSRRLRTC